MYVLHIGAGAGAKTAASSTISEEYWKHTSSESSASDLENFKCIHTYCPPDREFLVCRGYRTCFAFKIICLWVLSLGISLLSGCANKREITQKRGTINKGRQDDQ